MTNLSLIVAMDENRLIGSNNELPWRLSADLAFFKRTTMGKPIIMGRKTFISIGRPLPGRRNIVITRDPDFSVEGCEIANEIPPALALCSDAEEVMLIGGASLYQQTIDQATQLYVTRIHHSFAGDTWFPAFDLKVWKQASREDHEADQDNPYTYSFLKFVREF
jgi:dihydrofolate reductase